MKKVLVIGAGFLQSFVIQKAKQMGYCVLTVDADPNAIGFKYADEYAVINIVDEEACLNYARIKEIDGVLTAATDYGVLTAAYIAQEMELPGLKYEVAQLIKNKYKVRRTLQENGADDSAQAFEVDELSNLDKLSEIIHYPVMVKPCDGSGSRGANRVNCSSDFSEACRVAMKSSLTHKAVIESFVVGNEYGAESLVVNGEVFVLSIIRKWMTQPPYYAELGHAIPTDLPKDVEDHAVECVKKALKALGVNHGSVNMDLIISPNGEVHIIDVGARMGGNMIGPCVIPYGTGVEYIEQMLRVAVGDPVCMESVRKPMAICTRLLAFNDGVVKSIPDSKYMEDSFKVEVYHHMEAGMAVKEYHTNIEGLGYIIAKAECIEDAIDNADNALKYIRETCVEEKQISKR